MTPTKTMDSNQHSTTLCGTHKFKKSGISLDIKVETVNMAAYCQEFQLVFGINKIIKFF